MICNSISCFTLKLSFTIKYLSMNLRGCLTLKMVYLYFILNIENNNKEYENFVSEKEISVLFRKSNYDPVSIEKFAIFSPMDIKLMTLKKEHYFTVTMLSMNTKPNDWLKG